MPENNTIIKKKHVYIFARVSIYWETTDTTVTFQTAIIDNTEMFTLINIALLQ